MNNKLKLPLPPIPKPHQSRLDFHDAQFKWQWTLESQIAKQYSLDKITRPLDYELFLTNRSKNLKGFPEQSEQVIKLLMERNIIPPWPYLKRITYTHDGPAVTKYQLHIEWRTIRRE